MAPAMASLYVHSKVVAGFNSRSEPCDQAAHSRGCPFGDCTEGSSLRIESVHRIRQTIGIESADERG